ncbi:MAG: ArsR family transcriptional regulator [Nanoarchaeota archaeon]
MKELNLIKIKKPTGNDPNRHIIWLCESLGLITKRDKDRNCFKVFSEIVKTNKEKKYLTSKQISKTLKISRSNVIHYLNKLISSGLIIKIGNRYELREDNLTLLINEIEKDARLIFEDLKRVGLEVDKGLGM